MLGLPDACAVSGPGSGGGSFLASQAASATAATPASHHTETRFMRFFPVRVSREQGAINPACDATPSGEVHPSLRAFLTATRDPPPPANPRRFCYLVLMASVSRV